MMSNKCVAKIIHFGIFNLRNSKVSIHRSSDVSYKKWSSGLCYEQMIVFGVGPLCSVSFKCLLSPFVERNFSFLMFFIWLNVKELFFDVCHFKIGKFPDSDTGLKQKLNYGKHSWVVSCRISESSVFGGRKNSRRRKLISWVGDKKRRVIRNILIDLEESVKSSG